MDFPKLKSKLVLAPMADVSTLPFRLLCEKYGAALTYTEQLSSLGIIRENPRTLKLVERSNEEKLVGLQLFGRNSKILLKAALKLEKNFDIIDLNFGCPSKKIVTQGYGSALLREKDRVKKIIETLSNGLEKPVTVKMRSGFKKVEALGLVKIMEEAGASAITIHGRTREQGYSGKADWDIIQQVKEKVNIPVIGNGDVVSGEKAKELLEHTKCDYVMIARAAMNNPMIFDEINYYLKTGKKKILVKEDKVKLFLEYFELCEKYDFANVSNLRCTALNFCKGFNGSKELRVRLMKAKDKEKIIEEVERFGRI
ncbi:tRNA dihydrouridine synthase DusB [Candidatus Woesearchaeota archaeon]|nr:tRNA dihydrouridine synthase DusB [Candidatus Woesearchaeota archaeon]